MAKIYTSHLITLCNILDTYASFRNDLQELVKNKNAIKKINILENLLNKKGVLGNRDVKEFYHKYVSTLKIINANTFLNGFLSRMIFTRIEDSDIDFFYDYLVAHKEELDKVKNLLKKIKSLDINKITYEERDFKETYKLEYTENPTTILFDKYLIYYMANLEIIPNYTDGYQYRSTNTPYQMEISIYNSHIYCHNFIVNSLTFDPALLPPAITKEYTYDKVMNLVRNNQELKKYVYDIREALKLSYPLNELEKGYTSLSRAIATLNNPTCKEELLEALKELKLNLTKLKQLQATYNQSIIKSNPLITPEIIEKEEALYLKRLNDID